MDELRDAVKRVAWGYLLLHLHINLGRLDILPDWAGYLLILNTLPILGDKRPSVLLLKPPGQLLAVYGGFVWLKNIFGWTESLPALNLIAGIMGLYFHFQLLSDLAEIACGCPEEKTLLRLRTAYTLFSTLVALPFPWEDVENIATGLTIAGLISALWICHTLFRLSASLKMGEASKN